MQVVVLGSGPAGASAAITLRRQGAETLLIDPYPRKETQLGEGLPAIAQAQLRELDVWASFCSSGHLPCNGFLSSWGDPAPAFRSTVFDPYGPSWQLDRPAFDRALVEAAVAGSSVRRWRLVEADGERGRWTLRFSENQHGARHEIRADFVVDATGRRSAFARLLGRVRQIHTRTMCVAGVLADPDPDNGVTLVEAVQDGWWYASRVPGRRLVIGFFTDAATASRLRLTRWSAWRNLLGESRLTRERSGWPKVRPSGPMRTATAGSSSLDSCAGADWVAVGDAACAHDPLSSQGLFDALRTGIAGAEAAADAVGGDRDAGSRYAATMAADYRKYLAELVLQP